MEFPAGQRSMRILSYSHGRHQATPRPTRRYRRAKHDGEFQGSRQASALCLACGTEDTSQRVGKSAYKTEASKGIKDPRRKRAVGWSEVEVNTPTGRDSLSITQSNRIFSRALSVALPHTVTFVEAIVFVPRADPLVREDSPPAGGVYTYPSTPSVPPVAVSLRAGQMLNGERAK